MTDDELAMAYADGELDAISARRFEKRMAEAPELASAVAAHRALRERLRGSFAPVAEAPLPNRLTALLGSNVVEMRPRARSGSFWRAAMALAACLVAVVTIGLFRQSAPTGGSPQMASAPLARSLDTQLAGGQGATRVLVSFRDRQGSYCRVFQAPEMSGIACREQQGWALRQTSAHAPGGTGEYRQAGSADADLFAAAQGMMAGDPLDPAAERAAQARGWRD